MPEPLDGSTQVSICSGITFELLFFSEHLPSCFYGVGKGVENGDGIFPVDACISDAHPVLEASLALFGNLLVSCNQQRLARDGWSTEA